MAINTSIQIKSRKNSANLFLGMWKIFFFAEYAQRLRTYYRLGEVGLVHYMKNKLVPQHD